MFFGDALFEFVFILLVLAISWYVRKRFRCKTCGSWNTDTEEIRGVEWRNDQGRKPFYQAITTISTRRTCVECGSLVHERTKEKFA